MQRGRSRDSRQELDDVVSTLGPSLDSRAKLELLTFWAHYPSGWSTRGVIAPSSSLSREELYEGLHELVVEGIIETHDGPGMRFYRLRTHHPVYAAVLQLGKLRPKDRKHLMLMARV